MHNLQPPTSSTVTTRLDFNPLLTPRAQVQVQSTVHPVGANLIYDQALGQHIFVQSTPTGSIITAPVLEQQKQSIKWLIEHVPTASLAIRGTRVLARRHKDGYYYLATIGSPSSDSSGNFVIEFDENVSNLRMQKTSWFDMIALDDAMRHTLQAGDCCLAPFEKGGNKYAPGRILEGGDLDRIGASLRLQGTKYEKEQKILVQFGKNVAKTVKSSKCVWLPQVVYERLCSECGKAGRRDERTSHTTELNPDKLDLISYNDVPILPMPVMNWSLGTPIWSYCQPVAWQGLTYIPTFPHVWHQSFWPHNVVESQVITHSTHQDRVTVGDLKNEETCDVLEKLKDCNVSCSEDEFEHGNGVLNEVDNELEIWRKKRELKRALKKKIKDGNVELTSSSSDSSSDSSDSDHEHSGRGSRASKAILPATPGSSRLGCDAATQINIGARVSRKRYTRKMVEKRPGWVKYWKHGAAKYTNMNLPKVEFGEGKIHPAGGTHYNREDGKVYVGEQNAANYMRDTHEKVAAQERAKVRLDQARETRILNRLQNDLAREIGSAYPDCAVFSYNNSGKMYDHKATKNYSSQMKNSGNLTMVNSGNQTMAGDSGQGVYTIGNQTFQEKSVAVQVE